jgi:hypothetical protein
MRPLACWDCGFESCRRHGRQSRVSVVCCQVEVSATGRPLIQRSHTECDVSQCDLKTSTTMRRPRPTGAVKPWKKCFTSYEVTFMLNVFTGDHLESVDAEVKFGEVYYTYALYSGKSRNVSVALVPHNQNIQQIRTRSCACKYFTTCFLS